MVYRLAKRAISQFVRSDCQRRLRLDLYKGAADRAAARAPERDVFRPGFALATQAGRIHERRTFNELAGVLPGLLVHGDVRVFAEGEERAFGEITLEDRIERADHQIFIEAQYRVEPPFRTAHGLEDMCDGSFFAGATHLEFADVRPDIIQVLPPDGEPRRAIVADGRIEDVTDDRRGLLIGDIKISSEADPVLSGIGRPEMTLAALSENELTIFECGKLR